MMSDVCKHCVTAPCQQACPTGAIIHNEFENVYIQPDICNGCSLLHRRLPVRRHHPQPASTAMRTNARSATTARRTAWCRPAPRRARRRRSSSARSRSCASGPASVSRSCTAAACRALTCTATRPRETYSGLNSFYLLVDRPSVYGLPEKPFNPWLHMGGDYVRALVGGAGRHRRARRWCSLSWVTEMSTDATSHTATGPATPASR